MRQHQECGETPICLLCIIHLCEWGFALNRIHHRRTQKGGDVVRLLANSLD